MYSDRQVASNVAYGTFNPARRKSTLACGHTSDQGKLGVNLGSASTSQLLQLMIHILKGFANVTLAYSIESAWCICMSVDLPLAYRSLFGLASGTYRQLY